MYGAARQKMMHFEPNLHYAKIKSNKPSMNQNLKNSPSLLCLEEDNPFLRFFATWVQIRPKISEIACSFVDVVDAIFSAACLRVHRLLLHSKLFKVHFTTHGGNGVWILCANSFQASNRPEIIS